MKNPQQPVWRFLSGATAGIVSTTVTHPLDVVRARLTIQTKGNTAYSGILNAFRRIRVEEGMRGLYKGMCFQIYKLEFVVNKLLLKSLENLGY